MSMLDELEAYLRSKHESEEGKLWSPVRKYNWARLHQTPDIWGCQMDRAGVMPQTRDAVDKLADAMKRVIESAEQVVDITSLDPPRGPKDENSVFYNAILAGIKAQRVLRPTSTLLVRMLFGKPPISGRGDVHKAFKAKLAIDLKGIDGVKVVFGVFAGTSAGPVFNHSKIFASDAAHAVVGGHNLYDSDYREYPPVHDVSVEVIGPAAVDARNFASFLWGFGIADQTTWNPRKMLSNQTSTWIVAWRLSGDEWEPINDDFLKEPVAQHQTPPEDKVLKKPDGDGWCQCRILTVGRAGGWSHQLPGCYNASDYMKSFLISHATDTIKIAHQDLVAMDTMKMPHVAHSTCKDLGEALYSKDDLKVYAVVTAPYGSGIMDCYFNVYNGPQSATDYIMYYARPTVGTGKLRGVDEAARISLFNRLFVAPIHFTDKIPSPALSHYLWPDSQDAVKAGGSLAKPGISKSVGQHMKTMMIDDSVMVVGSDNHYPHPLAEINYVIDGAFVNEFREKFWDPLWRYSGPFAVQQWNSATVISGS